MYDEGMLVRAAGFLEHAAHHESGHVALASPIGIPIVAVTVVDHPHMMRDQWWQTRSLALEALTVVCLAGPCAEELFFSSITANSDYGDVQTAREILSRQYGPLEIGFQLYRMYASARAIVRVERHRIARIAGELLKRGTMTGSEVEQIFALGTHGSGLSEQSRIG